MKKIALLSLLFLTTCAAQAQYGQRPRWNDLDTMWFGEREPIYYYWDTNWIDKYLHKPEYQNLLRFQHQDWAVYQGCKPEHARYIYTDTTLRVIGIAAAIMIERHGRASDTADPWKGTVPDYLRLYEVDPETDSMILLASKSWYNLKPRRYQCLYRSINPNFNSWDENDFVPMYEVFFDSAITVDDSFYVAITSNNNYYTGNPKRPCFYTSNAAAALAIRQSTSSSLEFLPTPNHFRRKVRLVEDGEHNFDRNNMGFHATDTFWHAYAHICAFEDGSLGPDFFYWPVIFPIIDTSHYSPSLECDVPTDLGVMSITPQEVMLSWYGNASGGWELSVGPEGCLPETGTKTVWETTVATVTGLQQGQWYYAWVRALCDSTIASNWSTRLRFFVPADTTEAQEEQVETVVDIHTHIMPNPASEAVTVISAFLIEKVEVWTMGGVLAMKQDADAISATLDISKLTKGAYIVRIITNRGITYKKLIVE